MVPGVTPEGCSPSVVGASDLSAGDASSSLLGDVALAGLGRQVLVADFLAGGGDEVAYGAPMLAPGHNGIPTGRAGFWAGERLLSEVEWAYVHEDAGMLGDRLLAVPNDERMSLVVSKTRGRGSNSGSILILEATDAGLAIELEIVGRPEDDQLSAVGYDGHGSLLIRAVAGDDGASWFGGIDLSRRQEGIGFELAEWVSVDPRGRTGLGQHFVRWDADGDGTLEMLLSGWLDYENSGTVSWYSPSEGAPALEGTLVSNDIEGVNLGYSMTTARGLVEPDADALVVGGYLASTVGFGRHGLVWVLGSPLVDGMDVSEAYTTIEGPPAGFFGWALSPPVDLNQDGVQDVVVGAPGDPYASTGEGQVYVFLGPFAAGVLSVDDADLTIRGDCLGDRFGQSVGIGDLDGDRWPDLVVGAEGNSSRAVGGGAIYFFEGSGLQDAL